MEADVLQLLHRSPNTKFSAKEVSKLLDRHKFRENHSWARPILERLLAEKRIFKDADLLYYYSPEEEAELEKERKHRQEQPPV